MNASSVPLQDKCDESCSCTNGEVICEEKSCPESHIEPGMVCTEFFIEGECCPSHDCVKEETDSDLESGSQMMTTTSAEESIEESSEDNVEIVTTTTLPAETEESSEGEVEIVTTTTESIVTEESSEDLLEIVTTTTESVETEESSEDEVEIVTTTTESLKTEESSEDEVEIVTTTTESLKTEESSEDEVEIIATTTGSVETEESEMTSEAITKAPEIDMVTITSEATTEMEKIDEMTEAPIDIITTTIGSAETEEEIITAPVQELTDSPIELIVTTTSEPITDAPIEEETKKPVVPEEPMTEQAIAIETTTVSEPEEIMETTEPITDAPVEIITTTTEVILFSTVEPFSELNKELISGGDCPEDQKATIGDVLAIHYEGRLASTVQAEGRLAANFKFDSSIDINEPLVFELGSGTVIEGLSQGLVGTCSGQSIKLEIPSSLGYGSEGKGVIPADADLVFEVTILSIKKPVDTTAPEEIITEAPLVIASTEKDNQPMTEASVDFPTTTVESAEEFVTDAPIEIVTTTTEFITTTVAPFTELNTIILSGDMCSEDERSMTGDKLTMHYEGRLASNSVKFDSSFDRDEPITVELGIDKVIQGWTDGLVGICSGQSILLEIPSQLGYGADGKGAIPPNADLIFEITLLSIEKPVITTLAPEPITDEPVEILTTTTEEEVPVTDESSIVSEEPEEIITTETPIEPITDAPVEPFTELKANILSGDMCSEEERAMTGDKLTMHYEGRLASNSVKFDSSFDRDEPITVELGIDKVIQGWTDGLVGTCSGQTILLQIPSRLGYGAEGKGAIPPNADLVFEITLLSIEKPVVTTPEEIITTEKPEEAMTDAPEPTPEEIVTELIVETVTDSQVIISVSTVEPFTELNRELISGDDCLEDQKAAIGDLITVHYEGRLASTILAEGRVAANFKFDSSIDINEPLVFELGSGTVIEGLSQGLVGTCSGQSVKLEIPSSLGYGSEGKGVIPPDADLIFEINILSIEKPVETTTTEVVPTETPVEPMTDASVEIVTTTTEVVPTELPVEPMTDAPVEIATTTTEVVTTAKPVEPMTDAPEEIVTTTTEVVITEAPIEPITELPAEIVTTTTEKVVTTEKPLEPLTDAPVEPITTTIEPVTTTTPEVVTTTTTEVVTTTTEKQDASYCISNGMIIQDGKDVPSKNPCELCQCLFGQVICAERECPPAPKGCEALPLSAGECCPEYKCPTEGDDDEILEDDPDDYEGDDNAIIQKDGLAQQQIDKDDEELIQDKPIETPSLITNAPTYPPEVDNIEKSSSSTEASSPVVGTASSDILDDSVSDFNPVTTTSTSTTYAPEYFDEYEYDEGLTLDSIGPGACLFDGKVYVSAQQIPRTNPCDFCFCFRGDIICLQQSCPPPIPGCREETISGFCCPRYECPVKGGVQNITIPAPSNEPSIASWLFGDQDPGAAGEPGQITQQISGCEVQGHFYEVGAIVESSSGPCLQCR